MSERFTFFWGGPFSQWHPCRFEVTGVVYNCAEQFMMAGKARLFGDERTLQAIMGARKPQEQKALGRKVKPFSEDIWLQNARAIVRTGNTAKFTQNKTLHGLLMSTRGTTLVEASPFDTLWGIGLAEADPRALNRAEWMGQNWLGQILTDLREELAREPRGEGSDHGSKARRSRRRTSQ